MRCETYRSTLRRSIGLLWRDDVIDRAAAFASQQLPPVLENGLTFSHLEYPSRKMKEQQGLQEELNLG